MIHFGYFSFSTDSFGVEKSNTFIRSRGSLENHTRFKTIMVKIYIRFQTKTAQKNHTLWGGTYLYSLYGGVPPPPPGADCRLNTLAFSNSYTLCNLAVLLVRCKDTSYFRGCHEQNLYVISVGSGIITDSF